MLKISIVTISYNQAKYIEQCIRSIINQKNVNLEYIVVDPGSTDGSREIIKKYKKKITKIIFDRDKGPADGLNKGFNKASGDIFGYINSDDFLLPEALKKISTYFENNPDIDIVSGNGFFVDSSSKKTQSIVSSHLSLFLMSHKSVTFFQQGTFFRSSLFHNIKKFNINNQTCWDAEIIMDYLQAGAKFGLINDFLACFRIHSEGITGSGRLISKTKVDICRIYEEKNHHPSGNFLFYFKIIIARTIKYFFRPSYLWKKIFYSLKIVQLNFLFKSFLKKLYDFS